MKLKYDNREVDFGENYNLAQIKEGFHLLDSKNLYRVTSAGELIPLNEHYIKMELRDGDTIEAISEFSLG